MAVDLHGLDEERRGLAGREALERELAFELDVARARILRVAPRADLQIQPAEFDGAGLGAELDEALGAVDEAEAPAAESEPAPAPEPEIPAAQPARLRA